MKKESCILVDALNLTSFNRISDSFQQRFSRLSKSGRTKIIVANVDGLKIQLERSRQVALQGFLLSPWFSPEHSLDLRNIIQLWKEEDKWLR